ncbi:hypothetical protein GNE54_26345 [Trichormus variabilis V5]|nr:hypothetical protein [Trichormus variabilis V5]
MIEDARRDWCDLGGKKKKKIERSKKKRGERKKDREGKEGRREGNQGEKDGGGKKGKECIGTTHDR